MKGLCQITYFAEYNHGFSIFKSGYGRKVVK